MIKKVSNYLVCYEAKYAYSTSKFSSTVNWDGKNVDDLMGILRKKLMSTCCSGYDGYLNITLTSVTKLGGLA